ncbi:MULTISPECIES: hypothetical protein [Aquimarina]|uniref:hypothetical protein n=1 Tax=Aquimarina TaxID=290174 RepID=UPI00135B345C|nr:MULTISPECIES: hypothetical protein [Aquimarina]
MSKLYILVILLSVSNCKPTNSMGNNDNTSSNTIVKKDISKEMIEKGFSKGTIISSKSKDCPYILNVEEYNDNLDPVNLSDFFKTEVPAQVWVKFASLRRPSRCNDARPVSILEINTRKE